MKYGLSLVVGVGMAFGFLTGCGDSDSTGAESGEKASKYANSEEGLKELVMDLNHNRELLLEILPTKEECAMIGESAADAEVIAGYVEELKGQIPDDGIGGKEGQTELKLASGMTDEMKAGSEKDMAGGYSQKASHFKSGLTFWAVSYVEPGEEYGMRFDPFIFVNGRWVLVPKVWRAFR